MGGYGSGIRWKHSAKSTVEDCYTLDVNWMTREGMFDECWRSGSIRWSNSRTGKETSSIGYEVNTPDRWIRLYYHSHRFNEDFDYKIALTTTDLSWGVIRWWFICPLHVNGRYCGRRVGKLYLPPVGRHYGCRHCYDLTYESCQESHKYDLAFASLGAAFGITGSQVKARLDNRSNERDFKRWKERNEQRRRRRKARNWA